MASTLFAVAFAVAAIVGVATPAPAVVASLPGDADCDGLTTAADLSHLTREIADADGSLVAEADSGAVVSCSGADANGDGLVTAADFSALGRLLRGGQASAGPVITFLGIAAADGTTTAPAGDVPVPLYQSIGGIGFRLVVEAMPGPSGIPIGQQMVSARPDTPPDLQVQVTRDLGDGNAAVCGEGGVPGFTPPSYETSQTRIAALNDMGCRFEYAANPFRACTLDAFRMQSFVDARTRVQFCLSVSSVEAFPDGQTIVTARVLDIAGNPSAPVQIVVRVGSEPPVTVTPRPTATATRPPSPTVTETGPPRSPTPEPTATDSPRATATATASATPRDTATRVLTATASATPTRSETRTRTATPTASGTRTRTNTPGPSPTATETSEVSPTRTRTATLTPTLSPSRTPSSTPSPTRTAIASATPSATTSPSRTSTRTPTRTHSPTGTVPSTSTATRSPSVTRTATGPTVTRTSTPTRSVTPTRSLTPTHSVTPTRSLTPTHSLTPTRTLTPLISPTPSLSPTATRTPTRTAVGTRTATATPTASGTRTATFTRSATGTPTITGTLPPTLPPTATGTPSFSRTPTITRTPTGTRTPSTTRTPTETGTATRTGTVTRTATATGTFTATRTPTVTRTATRTGTATRTATETLTPSVTRTPTQTRTPTPTGRPGADVSYVGVVRANDEVVEPIGTTGQGHPIFERPFGFSFSLVVEGKPGPSRRPVGLNAFRSDPFDPSQRADIEIIVSRPLGDGSLAVCDDMLPFIGGIPASASFDPTQAISDAINDLACRFVNGSGLPGGRRAAEACTVFGDGEFRFVNGASTVQFCALIAEPFGFPLGDTLVTARIRDTSGVPGPAASFVVRVLP